MATKPTKVMTNAELKRAKATNTHDEILGQEPTHPEVKNFKADSGVGHKHAANRIGTDSFGERVYTFLTPLLTDLFIEGVCRTNNITQVCAEMNVSRMMIYAMKAQDPEFRQRLSDAQTLGIDSWEDAAATRAFNGIDRKVFFQGTQIDTVKDYSDSLAIAMLRGAKPERYATRTNNETVIGGSLGINLETLSDSELNEKINAKLTVLGSVHKPR